ncbi:MAG: hypothetical protein DIZ78_01270 [endosymbiont of Escarpia spicata]|uniref:Class III cytochrome C domain-containing protein n=1 Tax=endosymbiont of Escarpia spicata TaxID=2200908 RepID=A0A370DTR6_9GAMM|nr:MAG: hypothetical protein DIZ78_01270 [endosymbiont of Escarpia spicata]
MRGLLFLILGLLLQTAVLAEDKPIDQIPDDKQVIHFSSEFGMVTFYHGLHASLRTNGCETCHHTSKETGVLKPCHDCHHPKEANPKQMLTKSDASTTQKAFHVRCKGCHQYTIQVLEKPAGPVTCALCHMGRPLVLPTEAFGSDGTSTASSDGSGGSAGSSSSGGGK